VGSPGCTIGVGGDGVVGMVWCWVPTFLGLDVGAIGPVDEAAVG